MTLKNKQKQTSAGFHWLSKRGCKQGHLSMELSGKRCAFCFDVISRRSADVIRRAGEKYFNALSHNRAQP